MCVKNVLVACAVLGFFAIGIHADDVASKIKNLTGGRHVRIIWHEGDPNSGHGPIVMYGFDTDDGQGVRKIADGIAGGFLANNGEMIVYQTDKGICTMDWNGYHDNGRIHGGIISNVWQDGNGKWWVIYTPGFPADANCNCSGGENGFVTGNVCPDGDTVFTCGTGGCVQEIAKFPLDNPSDTTLITKMIFNCFWFGMSQDGTQFGTCQPIWGHVGRAYDLTPSGCTYQDYTKCHGCWASMASDNSYYVIGMEEGNHKHAGIWNTDGNRVCQIAPNPVGTDHDLNGPRFAQNGGHQFVTFYGPDVTNTGGSGTIFFGKIRDDMTSVESLVAVTDTSKYRLEPVAYVFEATSSAMHGPGCAVGANLATISQAGRILNVNFSTSGAHSVRVYSTNGAVVAARHADGPAACLINLNGVPAGVFTVRVASGEIVHSEKVVVR